MPYFSSLLELCYFTIFAKNILPFVLILLNNFFIATSLLYQCYHFIPVLIYDRLAQALKHSLNCYHSFNKQKVLGYKTPLETVKAWYHKNPLLFHDTFEI